MNKLTIALSKGRILKETLPLLKKVGIELKDDPDRSRKLILRTNDENLTVLIIRASDVPTYVRYGAADIGIAGKDILMEYEGDGLYEPLDLKIGRCKLMTAALPVKQEVTGRLRVATKYVKITRNFFAQRGQQVELIKLYGSIELAPIVGLADMIVDLVDTGNTLKANGLEAKEVIADISSWLIVNKASMKIKHDLVKSVISKFSNAVKV